jgi:hypothetical protein
MTQLIYKSKPAEPRSGDQIILDMRSGVGYVARDGYPMKFGSGGKASLSAFRFDFRSQTDVFHANLFLRVLGAASRLKLRRAAYSDPKVSCFVLTEGDA